MTRVVGIDPSLTSTGLALIDGDAHTVVEGDSFRGDRRLVRLYAAVTAATTHADVAVVEDLPTHAHGAGKTGMAQGVVRCALLLAEVPYLLVPAAVVKKFATGRGNATKPDMRMEWFRRTEHDVRDDNQVDALWLRALGLHLAGEPLFPLPKTHTDVLAKVTWPSLAVPS